MPSSRSPAPRSKRLSAEARRDLILRQAKALFAERGYGATSLDDVARAAGVTKPVVYDHFASKRDLYAGLMLQLRDALLEEATVSLSASATPRERLKQAITHYFEQVKRDPAIVQLLFTVPRHDPDLAQEWQRLEAEAIGQLKPLVRALAPRLETWQVNVTVQLLHHGLNATAQAWPRSASSADMANHVFMLLWKGLAEFSGRP
jgi:AcrR family transcriptional regulator